MTTHPGHRCLALPLLLRLADLRLAGLLLTGLLLTGCGPHIPSLFEITTQAAEPPPQALQYDLDELPYREYWVGLILLGDKVGFSHLRLEATQDGGYLLESEAAMNFKVLGYEKKVHLLARDWVGPKLQLRRFQYEHHIDDSVLLQEGEVSDGQLRARIKNSAGTSELQETLAEPLYPGAAVNLYPLLQGLRPDAVYDYLVYDGQSLQITQVQQQVIAYESSDLFEGPAYKLRTTMGSDAVRTWIDEKGRPTLEISSHNLIIAGLESEQRARHYLTLGALSKKESLIDFSLVRGDRKLKNPRKMRHLELELSGLGELQLPGNTARQQCTHGPKPGQAVCRIHVQADASSPPLPSPPPILSATWLAHCVFPQTTPPSVTWPNRLTTINNTRQRPWSNGCRTTLTKKSLTATPPWTCWNAALVNARDIATFTPRWRAAWACRPVS